MIRLLGTLTVLATFIFAACGGSGCKDIASSINMGEDGIPQVFGEVVTTESCLQFIDFKVGEGDTVQPDEIVSVHFTGYLEDGSVYDSSVKRGEPIAFSLNRVMEGWNEGIQGMRVNGKRRLFIPPELASGTFFFGSTAPPDTTVIYDIELLELVR